MPPIRTEVSQGINSDYQWDNMDAYIYDYDSSDEREPTEAEYKEQYMQSIKIMTFLLILLCLRVFCVLCPCVFCGWRLLVYFVETTGICKILCFPCRYSKAFVVCYVRGWGTDVPYYFIREHCSKRNVDPPEYEDYVDYKNNLPKTGRNIAQKLIFGP